MFIKIRELKTDLIKFSYSLQNLAPYWYIHEFKISDDWKKDTRGKRKTILVKWN